jgi:hypothetical protein
VGNSKNPRIITKMNDQTPCIANLHSLKYKPLSQISRVYISLEMDHKNLETLGFSRGHQKVMIMKFRGAYNPLKDPLAHPNFGTF